ncbi:pyridoxamine 5'-phosphate oxidase family protein [uncultured Caulobacter sp.]|uniref:pyridoxamine 5'-phosphate oxidase family protein n=1 Tax=uncultured Caulobacter sp. TaxID=158749 RepID=UPI002639526C|nr:pyridoxamine 5'-phosphate oxidase family protein [uncultured Caulobacter sp.]
MHDASHDQDDAERRLWKEIDHARFGMLGIPATGGHFQPMTAFAEPEDKALWFFTSKDTDLLKSVRDGQDKAMFIVEAKDQDFQACVAGRLSEDPDRERIERYWNPMVAAWFPRGKDDPSLTLLRFDMSDAQTWASKGAVRFAWEIAKANITGTLPDIGHQDHVTLS